MLIFPLANSTTYRINHTLTTGTFELAGYVFASPGSTADVQEQRWVLYEPYFRMLNDLRSGARAEDSIRLREPEIERRYTTPGAWREAVRSTLWVAGATYVKVTATSYDRLVIKDPRQLIDDMVARIYRADDNENATLQGFAEGGPLIPVSDRDTSVYGNVEYWLTQSHYVNKLGAGVSKLRLDLSWKSDREVPFVASKWQDNTGSTFTVANCTYHSTLPDAL
jgi:hypothetical protein